MVWECKKNGLCSSPLFRDPGSFHIVTPNLSGYLGSSLSSGWLDKEVRITDERFSLTGLSLERVGLIFT